MSETNPTAEQALVGNLCATTPSNASESQLSGEGCTGGDRITTNSPGAFGLTIVQPALWGRGKEPDPPVCHNCLGNSSQPQPCPKNMRMRGGVTVLPNAQMVGTPTRKKIIQMRQLRSMAYPLPERVLKPQTAPSRAPRRPRPGGSMIQSHEEASTLPKEAATESTAKRIRRRKLDSPWVRLSVTSSTRTPYVSDPNLSESWEKDQRARKDAENKLKARHRHQLELNRKLQQKQRPVTAPTVSVADTAPPLFTRPPARLHMQSCGVVVSAPPPPGIFAPFSLAKPQPNPPRPIPEKPVSPGGGTLRLGKPLISTRQMVAEAARAARVAAHAEQAAKTRSQQERYMQKVREQSWANLRVAADAMGEKNFPDASYMEPTHAAKPLAQVCPFMEVSEKGLSHLTEAFGRNHGADDVVFDIGCGYGLITNALVSQFGCTVIGVEVNPQIARIAEKRLRHHGAKVKVIVDDVRALDLSSATAVVMFFTSCALEHIKHHLSASLPAGCMLYNYAYPVKGWLEASERLGLSGGVFKYIMGEHLPVPPAAATAPVAADLPTPWKDANGAVTAVNIEAPPPIVAVSS